MSVRQNVFRQNVFRQTLFDGTAGHQRWPVWDERSPTWLGKGCWSGTPYYLWLLSLSNFPNNLP
jgi:hypothetical protein